MHLAIGGHGCWLEVDGDPELLRLEQAVAQYSVAAAPSGDSGVVVARAKDGRPRIRIVCDGETRDPREMLAGPEWQRLVAQPDPSRTLYIDPVFGTEPALEIVDGEIGVLQEDLWSMVALMALVWVLLRQHPLVCLHAAVCALDGHALVLLGPSGAGKSTLAWALHQQGADYFGDEWAFFTLSEHHLYPWERPLCVRPGGVQALGPSSVSPVWYETKPGDPKWAISLAPPDVPCPRDRVSFLFLDGFSASPAIAPLGCGEAARLLLRGLHCGDLSLATRLGLAADLAASYRCWKLAVGAPAETAALLRARGRDL